MDTSEKRFEQDIESFLTSPAGGYEQFAGPDGQGTWVHRRTLDVSKCIYMDVLCEFLAKTQPQVWEKYIKYYGNNYQEKLYTRLENVITQKGLLYVLRNGIEDMGFKLRLCYFKPESTLNPLAKERYEANILGCSRQFHYSTNHNNSLDMVLSLNGIPIIALELKNQLKGQDYTCAIKQFKQDRDPKEFAFRDNHRFFAYFAVDLYEAWMTTRLEGSSTRFLPFNQGSKGAGVTGGAGNPPNPNGYATSYLWQRVLQRDSLMHLIHRFIAFIEDKPASKANKLKGKIIFPRYHQYDVVKKLLAHVATNGAGHNYLIQHFAGSGKSNSIAWIAYALASLHDADNKGIFDSVIVVTNRIVLDNQLQDTINSFEHQAGLVEAIDQKKNSSTLAEALNNKRRIIICTIQKFLFARKEIESYQGRNFAIIIDEAHQGQSGESARALRRSLIDMGAALKEYAQEADLDESSLDLNDAYLNAIIGQGQHPNQSFFAFTATPKAKTLEIFGTTVGYTEAGEPIKAPFHVYSMEQAIEEGYILDVLAHYTTIQEAFKLVRTSSDNPELIEGKASKALFKYYKQHGYTIAQKTEMLMTNFLENCRYQINGKGKAMVVTDSRANAVRYYLAIKDYLQQHAETCAGSNVMVAFSGEVTLPDYPSDKPFTEAAMNVDAEGKNITTDKKFRQVFHSDQYNILVVANKYQTGFDEPLLHTMYVDKKLQDVAAVQTLSRLNRTAAGKHSTFVLDFANTEEDIKKAFLPYYQATTLEGSTDVNKVYDLRNRLRDYLLYNLEDVTTFNKFMEQQLGKRQSATALGRLTALLQPVIKRYLALEEEDRYLARDLVGMFTKAYAYVTQMVRLHDETLFQEYQYTQQLFKLLPPVRDEGMIDIVDKIKLEYASFKETFSGAILLKEKPPVMTPGGSGGPKPPNKTKEPLQNIIDKINERFGGDFTDGDRVIITGIYNMFMKDEAVRKYKKYAKNNSTEMFIQSLFPDKFKELVTKSYSQNRDTYKKLYQDTEFYNSIMEVMAQELYKELRKD